MKKRLAKKIIRNLRYPEPPINYPDIKFWQAYNLMLKKNWPYMEATERIIKNQIPKDD